MISAFLESKILFLILLAFLLFHGFALSYHWYYLYTWLDIPMHIAGGFLTATIVVYLLRRYTRLLQGVGDRELLFSILGGVALIGILWEFQEFFFDVFFTARYGQLDVLQPSAADTLKDLADDLLGGLAAFFVLAAKARAKGK